jgi:hypothetical protein
MEDGLDPLHHCYQSACFLMLESVPGGTSSFIWPGTVTFPGFEGCLN